MRGGGGPEESPENQKNTSTWISNGIKSNETLE